MEGQAVGNVGQYHVDVRGRPDALLQVKARCLM